jgi:dienelactone hydrolase
MDFGWYGDRDLSAAVAFTVARPDVRDGRVGVVGLSMGGEEAIGAAAADPQIRAVVAEGATARTAADRDWLSQQYGVQGWMQEQIDRLTYGIADLLTDAGPPTQLRAAVAAAAPRPVLLIAGGDVPDEPLAGRFIQAGSPRTVQLWVVPGSGHLAGLAAQPQLWELAVVDFLRVSLAR